MGKTKQQIINSKTDFFYYAFRNILLVGLPLIVVFGFVLSLSHSSARVSSSDNLSISVPSSCTLSSSVDEAHSASIVNGTYEEDIGKTTLTTFCNDRNGYSIYAIGDSLNSEGNNKLVSNINSNYDIVSGTATSGDTSNWAMKLNSITSFTDSNTNTTVNASTPPTIDTNYNNIYGIVPDTWTRVASIQSGTTDMLQGSSFTTTYATYISPTQAAGTYTGQVKYLLAHPYSAPAGNAYIMQEVADWEDELTDEGDNVVAIDARDGKGYYVTRLADGHIWMTQNLDFDITANTTLNSMTTDLNVAYNSTTGQYAEYNDGYSVQNGISYWAPVGTATTIDFTGTTVTGWQNSNTEPYSASKTDDTNTGHASLGNYYNWTAAIASNNSSTLTSNTINDISQNPQNSICPKGWRLPTISNQFETTIGSTNEFARLNYLYNGGSSTSGVQLKLSPTHFVLPGYINNGLMAYNNDGYYWSSTTIDNNNSYSLGIRNNGVWVKGTYPGKSFGWSVRCVAR